MSFEYPPAIDRRRYQAIGASEMHADLVQIVGLASQLRDRIEAFEDQYDESECSRIFSAAGLSKPTDFDNPRNDGNLQWSAEVRADVLGIYWVLKIYVDVLENSLHLTPEQQAILDDQDD